MHFLKAQHKKKKGKKKYPDLFVPDQAEEKNMTKVLKFALTGLGTLDFTLTETNSTDFLNLMEKAMATHPSTLAWKIPWTEEPGRLQSMGSQGVGHDWATSLSRAGEGNGNPLQCSCLENPKDGGAWWAAVYGVAQSQTWLKQFSSSSWNLMSFYLEP